MAMNAQTLNNPLAHFHHNEQKAIAQARRHELLKWDRLNNDLQYTFEVHKPTFVSLTSSHILRLLGMITWGVGSIPFNV
jgi:hypothetical protein